MTTKTKETITFNHFNNYDYGLNWVSIYTLYKSDISNLCDTGYNNVLHGRGEAVTSPFSDGYGIFESVDFSESFAMKSMFAAPGWCGEQKFTFNSYSYQNGQVMLKASDTITLSQAGQKIDFGNYGKDFRGIVAVNIVSDALGTGGSTCTYGSPTYGYQMAFDNLKLVWNGPIPGDRAEHKFMPLPYMQHFHAHHAIAALAALSHGAVHGQHESSIHAIGPPGHAHGGFHSELMSLHDAHADLTSQFALPAPEHFGT